MSILLTAMACFEGQYIICNKLNQQKEVNLRHKEVKLLFAILSLSLYRAT